MIPSEGGKPHRQAFGLSETLGAFVGGVLVAETDYKHQIEVALAAQARRGDGAEVKPT